MSRRFLGDERLTETLVQEDAALVGVRGDVSVGITHDDEGCRHGRLSGEADAAQGRSRTRGVAAQHGNRDETTRSASCSGTRGLCCWQAAARQSST
jgi:hypothetical protein